MTEWAHDADGYLTSVTFPEGNGIKYTLNANQWVTERRHKADMSVADSASNDLIHEWEYDATHSVFVTKYTDPEGNETDYTLNSDGQPTQVTFETLTNVSPTVTIDHDYTYNSDGTVATAVDGESKTTKTVYYTTGAKKGRVKERIVDFGGLALKTEYDYTDWGDVKKVTDPEGNITEFEVEEYGNVTKITYPAALGYITEFEHDANLNVTTKKVKNIDETGTALTSPSWWETDYAYDAMDNVTSTLEDVSTSYQRNTEIQYDANENRTLYSVGSGSTAHMNEWTYDERDMVYEHTRAGGGVSGTSESFDYDDNGNLEEHTNNRGKVTTHAYDGFDRRTSTTNALSDYAEYVYDKNGNLTDRKFYDELGATDDLMAHHKRHYDEMNRFYKEEDLLEGTTNVWHDRVYERDKRGLVTSVTNRRGEETTSTFDGARRRTNRTDALGNEIDWTYDDNGNVTKVEETEVIPGSMSTEVYETQFTFDAINRRLTSKVIDRNLGTNFKLTTWKYNSRNVVAERLDPKNNKVTFEHDGLGRVTKKTEDLAGAAEIVTQWELDDWNNVTKLTDDNGKETVYAFDLMNRLESKTYDDTTDVNYEYDDNDNVTKITDQNGTVVDLGYDDLDRMIERDATLASGVGGDTAEDFYFDALGRMTKATDDDSTVEYTYDSLSRVLTEKQGDNPLSTEAMTVTCEYDAESNLTQIDYPSGFESHRTYDEIDRLELLEDDVGADIASFDLYGAGGRRKQVDFENGTATLVSYDGFRRPTDIAHEDSGSAEFAGFEYGWDKNDNPTYEERSHQSNKGDVYTYDKANRLTTVLEDVDDPANEVANPGAEAYLNKREYNLDDVFNFTSLVDTPYGGNAATTSFTANGMNEYTDVGGTTHVYDDNGNLTDDGTNTYEYDARNHLIEVVDKSSTTTIATYKYDAVGRGRRTEKTVGSDTTRFVYLDQHVVEELDGSDDLLRLFVYADGWDNVVMMEAEDVADVDSDANTTEIKRFYYHSQLIGSVTHITDEDEVVVEDYDYDPYGQTAIFDINGGSVTASQIGNPFMYTGRRLDEESGLYYYRARHYSPELGRFVQRDPLEYVDGPNAFTYVGSSPTSHLDPSGLNKEAMKKVGGAAAKANKIAGSVGTMKEAIGIVDDAGDDQDWSEDPEGTYRAMLVDTGNANLHFLNGIYTWIPWLGRFFYSPPTGDSGDGPDTGGEPDGDVTTGGEEEGGDDDRDDGSSPPVKPAPDSSAPFILNPFSAWRYLRGRFGF